MDQVGRCASRWHVASIAEADLLRYYQAVYTATVPRHLSRGCRTLRSGHLPYVYATVKSKCWKEVSPGRVERAVSYTHLTLPTICSV
eukprot:2587577-Alexandrium_andersonii.AAC.1